MSKTIALLLITFSLTACQAPVGSFARGHEICILGRFDIDHTGSWKYADRNRMRDMITTNGGRVSNELTARTDFVVTGEVPPLPPGLEETEKDPVKIAQHAAATREHQAYRMTVDRARQRGVTVLNQDEFLDRMGYGRR